MTATDGETSIESVSDEPTSAPQARGGLLRAARRHWLFLAILVAGTGLRVVVTIAYWPALEFFGDTYEYLAAERTLHPTLWPAGYPIFLRILSVTGHFGSVSVVQHILGIGVGVAVYALLVRLGVRPWLAALGATPVLLDAFQLGIEQFVLAETLTDALLAAALVLVLWRRRTGAAVGAVVGVLLAVATVTRTAVLPVLAVVGLYLVLRAQWRGLAAYVAGCVAVLAAYTSVFGSFGYSGFTGYYLYGRVASFARCDRSMSTLERQLCPTQPVSRRPYVPDYWTWSPGSPIQHANIGGQAARNSLGKTFAEYVILHQPLGYAHAVLSDVWHYFTPGRSVGRNGDRVDVMRWEFPLANLDGDRGLYLNGDLDALHVYFANVGFGQAVIKASPDPSLMQPLRDYQSVAYTQGPILLAALVGALIVGLRLGRQRARRRQARWAALLLSVTGLVLVVTPSLTTGFSYRYGLPLLVLLPPAGVLAADLGIDVLMSRWSGRRMVEPDVSMAYEGGSS